MVNSLMTIVAMLGLLTIYPLTIHRSPKGVLYMYTFQSLLVASIPAALYLQTRQVELLILCALLILIKSVIIPAFIIRRNIKYAAKSVEPKLAVNYAVGISSVTAVILFTLVLFYQILPASFGGATRIVAVSGFSYAAACILVLSFRRYAESQILLLLCVENGILLASLVMIPMIPILAEVIIAFETLVAVITLAWLNHHMRYVFGHTDTFEMKDLRG